MANFLEWTGSNDTRDTVHIIVQALVEGKLVVLPAETAYHAFASALKPDAVSALAALADGGQVRSPAMFLRSSQEAFDYSPEMSPVALRAVTRGWPGPLVLRLPVDSSRSLAVQLPESVKKDLLGDGGFLAQRVAAHEAILHAMRLMPGPLVAAPVVDSSGKAICAGREAGDRLGGSVALTVDDGVTHYGGFATTVQIEGNRCSMINDGVLDTTTLDQLFQMVVLLVCTGNTCRSPMAEVLLRDRLAKRFPEQMNSSRPLAYIASAGLSAFPGGPASSEAQAVVKKRGLSLQAHQARSVTERSLRHADFVLTMTHSHRAAILDRLPDLANKVQLLSGTNHDVADPFGGSEAVYAACAEQIDGYLQKWVGQLEESWFPNWQSKLS